MEKVSIIGFGRFGKVLANLLKDDFEVLVTDLQNVSKDPSIEGCKFVSREEALESDTIFYAVPISKFEQTLKSHLKYFQEQNKPKLLIDVLSVKVFPKEVFEKYLPDNFEALLTHPMFGPDSVRFNNGFKNLPFVLDQFKTKSNNYKKWKNFFLQKELKIIEMSADEHDKMASESQGIAHFLGRVLEEFGLQSTPIDTIGAKKLLEVMSQTCNDTWQLFYDLQTKNPYTKGMRLKLGESYDKIYNQLMPEKTNGEKIIYGIQGGVGSFNEQAINDYLSRNDIQDYEIKYLFTSEKVLKALHEGDIDFGLFALHNSVGGIVQESIEAMAKYKFQIVEEFFILIRHFLMKRKDVKFEDIRTVMSHDQVFKQCKETIARKYPNLNFVTGEGDMRDHAKVAWALANNKIDSNIAVMGPEILSKIYDLDIIERDLQDNKNNLTSFLLVKRT